jgi:glycosyltransferase involved in cell wall biosynthesis
MNETRKGGTRIQGLSPRWEEGWPVVSIITVVFNGAEMIEKTIQTVLGQTYPSIEYLLIDGGSKDGTIDIIRRYEDRINYWISEPDKGIYDAMNKGLAAATGDYVWFMNAGDLVYREDTLEKIIRRGMTGETPGNLLKPWPLIFYGDTMVVNNQYQEVGLRRLRPPEVLTRKSFQRGMLVCHQAILVARSIAEPFDPQYRHSADYDWVLRAIIKAEGRKQKANPGLQPGIINTHQILCAFLDGGHSKQNIVVSLKERFHSMVRHYGWLPTVIRHVPIAVKFFWYWVRKGRF